MSDAGDADANRFNGASAPAPAPEPVPVPAPAPSFTERVRARWAQRRHLTDGGGRNRPAPKRTAFVLAGGGSRGAVQVGMLQELIRRDIRCRSGLRRVGRRDQRRVLRRPTDARERRAHGRYLAWGEGDRHLPPRPTRRSVGVLAEAAVRALQRRAAGHHRVRDRLREPGGCHHPDRGGGHIAYRRPGALDRPRPGGGGDPGLLGHPVHLPPGHHRRRSARRWRRREQRADQPRLDAGCDRIYVLLCGPLHFHPPAVRGVRSRRS